MEDIESQADYENERQQGHLKTYLGDGLYARFDGYAVILSAPREHGEHWVCLEPEVLQAFQDWLKTLPSHR